MIGGISLIRQQIEERAVATLQKTSHMKPVMSHETERQVLSAVAQFKDKSKWRQWGLSHYRDGGAVVLLWGPPGTGKTTIARWAALKVKVGLIPVDLAQFGSQTPGENERQLEAIYKRAALEGKGLFLDEADSILWNRATAGDAKWMVAVINKLLTLISTFKGIQFLASNRKEDLDPALNSRLLADVYIGRPDYEQRLQLWKQKIPSKFPFQPTQAHLQELATLDLSGREIENAVLQCAGQAIFDGKLPSFDSLCNVAKIEAARVIK